MSTIAEAIKKYGTIYLLKQTKFGPGLIIDSKDFVEEEKS
jgi:hypothetical protein